MPDPVGTVDGQAQRCASAPHTPSQMAARHAGAKPPAPHGPTLWGAREKQQHPNHSTHSHLRIEGVHDPGVLGAQAPTRLPGSGTCSSARLR